MGVSLGKNVFVEVEKWGFEGDFGLILDKRGKFLPVGYLHCNLYNVLELGVGFLERLE